MAAQKEKVAVWRRIHDWAELVQELGDLLAGEAGSRADFEAGHLHGYEVEGDGYTGWIALLFEEFADLTMRCTVKAVKGMGVPAWLADLRRLLDKTPARCIELNAETIAHIRLYNMAGFKVEACRMTMEL